MTEKPLSESLLEFSRSIRFVHCFLFLLVELRFLEETCKLLSVFLKIWIPGTCISIGFFRMIPDSTTVLSKIVIDMNRIIMNCLFDT